MRGGRSQLESEIVLAEFDLLTSEAREIVSRVGKAHGEGPDADQHLARALWDHNREGFEDVINAVSAPEGDNQAAQGNTLTEQGSAAIIDYIDRAYALDDELAELDDSDLKARYQAFFEQRRKSVRAIRKKRGESFDKFAFFNLPEATANIEEWIARRFWTAEEAVAISLGKDPRRVNATSLADVSPDSIVAQEFRRRLDLVVRSVDAQQLKARISPESFVDWAKNHDNATYSQAIVLLISKPKSTEQHLNTTHKLYSILLVVLAEHYNLDIRTGELDKATLADATKKLGLSVTPKTIDGHVRKACEWARERLEKSDLMKWPTQPKR